MPFTYLTNLPLEQAEERYPAWLAEGGFQPKTETVPVAQSAGRVTARAVYATLCAPHYPACAMDGIAVAAADTFGATETTPVTLEPTQFTVVDTGDPLPEGKDAVVMIEDVLWEGEKAVLHEAAAPWQHIRQIGEDVCAGEMLLPTHTSITPAAIGAMIAGGVLAVEVFTRPVVGIIPTGDEVADLLHQSHPHLYMSSTHVGSMGGIMALRRGEAHGAGCHLLDEADGSYNTSYLEKYFPHGGVYQVECVGRTQGLMVAKGNPLGIKGFGDIANLRYVNRQKGSGTRILADYLCRKEGIDPAAVYGYDREELTHTSVAAQIAAGTADAGMGILSAARLYDLDFLPVCVEQYDLLIPDYAWGTPAVEALLEVLQSPAFRERLEQLGGYTIDQPGRVRRHF